MAGPPEDTSRGTSHDRRREERRLQAFCKELQRPVASLDVLRALAWRGIPPGVRPLVWRILFGLAPPTAERRAAHLGARRAAYGHVVAQHFGVGAVREEAVARQVVLDVARTAPEVSLFRRPEVAEGLVRVLYCAAIRRPAASYVQGMNDLAVPLYYVFFSERVHSFLYGASTNNCCSSGPSCADTDSESTLTEEAHTSPISPISEHPTTLYLTQNELDEIEADTYWCLLAILDATQDTYTAGQAGVLRQVERISFVVGRARPALAAHLAALDVQAVQWAFRWINCMLLREFPLSVALRLWDGYLGADEASGAPGGAAAFADFHSYVCAAFVGALEADLLACRDFHDALSLLQNPPTAAWTERHVELLLAEAFLLRSLFHNCAARP